MTDLEHEGIHITTLEGVVVRGGFKDRKAARQFAQRRSRNGPPVILVDPGKGFCNRYVDGHQSGQGWPGLPSGEVPNAALSAEDAAGEDSLELSDLVEALGDRKRAVPSSEFDDEAPDARHCGIYAWWADEEAHRLIEDTLGADAAERPIYIGQASQSQTLATRVLGKHLNGTTRNSTLRWSLTALLMTTSAFADQHPDPHAIRTSPALSAWMREHLAVAIFPVEARQLDQAERAALDCYDPPLNQRDAPTSSAVLTRLRKLVSPRPK